MTPPQSEPTLGEVLRRLDDLSRQMLDLVREIKEDRSENAKTFVRQDVYIAQRLADQAVTADLAGDLQSLKDDRKKDLDGQRQRNLTLGLFAITTLVSIALSIVNILAR